MTGGFPHSEISGSKVIWHLPETYRSHITSFIASWSQGIHHTPLHSCKECCTPLYNFTIISWRYDWVLVPLEVETSNGMNLFDCVSGTKRPECSATRHFIGSNPIRLPVFLVYMSLTATTRNLPMCRRNTLDFSNTPLSRVFWEYAVVKLLRTSVSFKKKKSAFPRQSLTFVNKARCVFSR